MKECVKCGLQFGWYEGFGEICQKCYVIQFEKEFSNLLKGVKK
jgi:hypothetical protein